MREIKFRVYNKKDKLWVAGWSIGQSGVQSETADKVFMQYTGLQDKNGKEIYEGDIILCKRNGLKGTAQVIWEEHIVKNDYKGQYSTLNGYEDFGSWNIVGINESALAMHTGQFEVIGNIYENQELLDKD